MTTLITQQALSLNSTICRSKELLSTQIDDEMVLMSIDRGNYYGLDAIATDIWQRLEQPVAVSDLCAALVKEYDADTETISRDVLSLLEQFASEGFIDFIA
ncbi:PqqD family peptide modification chaperone [Methylomonas fluvii]|uniref:PqqD family protein n=1 Tax=Methylomonas fluvii TaxID=1854564 RepID=A0ABR9DH92_9GAMM|nr:PqqD family peptide modification chaperone [Methylomonas fluvii]MBD9362475.1 PqqD family protein [Methylomonas fluvii]CAD6875579.1 hypothetical protein [Methylomonas fluvii]